MAKKDKQSIINDFNSAINFINTYKDSPGFKQRYSLYHPLGSVRFLKSGYVKSPRLNISNKKPTSYNLRTATININPDTEGYLDLYGHSPYDVYNTYGSTNFAQGAGENHEMGHYFDEVLSNPNNYEQGFLDKIKQFFIKYNPQHSYNYPQLRPNKRKVNKHDYKLDENYADFIDFRKRLLDDGIYNSTKENNPFTKEHLKKAKEKYKDVFIRPFNNFTDDRIIQIMNTVAQNNENNKNRISLEDIYYA